MVIAVQQKLFLKFLIDDNRNNLGQLGVRKRTCFVGTAIFSNWTAIQ